MMLEQYLKREYAEGKIDFQFRAHVSPDGVVEIYIHPVGKNGMTTPSLVITGDVVSLSSRVVPGPDWFAHE
jgi:hypothetical protein